MTLQRTAKFAELPFDCKRVVILVQAPVDQSPRMLAQAWMFAEAGADVQLVAFGEAADLPLSHPRIHFHAVKGAGRDTATQASWPLPGALFRATGMARQLRQALQRACADADLLLAQVPPVLPGLWLALRQQVPLVLDWHNLSAPMAALKFGQRHPVVPLLEILETKIGRRAQAHFAVTGALAQHLSHRLVRPVHALADRPLPVMAKAAASPLQPMDGNRLWYTLVCPTSWSRDEPMDVLLDAVTEVSIPAGRGLRIVVTGKGPLRAAFEVRAATLRRPGLHIETAWFPAAGYRALLHHAHCGISLHRSASGLDFPMKIIDMEAAGLPVLALDYGPVLHDGLSGLAGATTFTDAAGLAGLLEERLNAGACQRYPARPDDWQDCWSRTALPVLSGLLP